VGSDIGCGGNILVSLSTFLETSER